MNLIFLYCVEQYIYNNNNYYIYCLHHCEIVSLQIHCMHLQNKKFKLPGDVLLR